MTHMKPGEGDGFRLTNPPDRRQMLGRFAAAALALIRPPDVFVDSVADANEIAGRRLLLTAFSPDGQIAAAAVGKAYLAKRPDEADISRLVTVVFGPRARRPYPASRNVVDRISEDLKDGHVTLVDGWVLSRTEARLCALAFLLRGA